MHSMEYSVPESWTENVSDENTKYYYPENGMLMVGYDELDTDETISDDELIAGFMEGFNSTFDSFDVISESKITIEGKTGYTYYLNNVLDNEEYKISVILFDYQDGVISFMISTESDEDYSKNFENIYNSIEFTDEAIQ